MLHKFILSRFLSLDPSSEELWTQKLKFHLVRTQSLNVFPLKPGTGQYIPYMLRLLPGIFSLLISTLPVHSPAFFSKTSPDSFVPVQARRIKLVTLLDAGSRVQCPRNINRLGEKKPMTFGIMTCEVNNFETE